MLLTASRALLQQAGEMSTALHWMRRISARVPESGLSGSQLQALLDDEFPSFSPSEVGAVTLKEAVLRFPELLSVEDGTQLQAKWHVRPTHARKAQEECVSSSPKPTETYTLPMLKLQQFCTKRARMHHNTYMPLEYVLSKADIHDVNIVGEVLSNPDAALDVQAGVRIKPKRTPRAVVAFVDGDLLPAVAVDEMCNELKVLKESSIVTIVRQPGSHALSAVDIVCPDVIPTYLSIEKYAHELRLRRPYVRHDVVYMCAASQFNIYAGRVALLNEFPDADVYVCCPSMIALVKPKKVIPFE
ncbi:conserved hypothetical protein [Leishmania mexicana MHOM/GT/2001/U1103]|uniref:Uncharacterized protein n=1 Tax=Leishmania mexicana (strain MHOM/GT/2001/U1103) TaxID=929439 RepID=E9AUV5_LEIMU|nr:conserved hypothetical protein [Leishmania mexicana MHOM/GT/2001/U1103]CBZ26736.1 conserved hypothetical protein [Leishmania mexicana MHOM/GT/2001/U1103]